MEENRKLYILGFAGALGTKHIIIQKKEELLSKFSVSFLNNCLEKIENEEELNKKIFSDILTISKNNLIELTSTDKFFKSDEDYYKNFFIKCKKGGVLSGIWNITNSFKIGVSFSQKCIPIHQATIEISEFYKINPYRLLCGNVYLFMINSSLLEMFSPLIKNFSYIGEFNNTNQKIRIDSLEHSFLTKEQKDEIDSIIPKFTKSL